MSGGFSPFLELVASDAERGIGMNTKKKIKERDGESIMPLRDSLHRYAWTGERYFLECKLPDNHPVNVYLKKKK